MTKARFGFTFISLLLVSGLSFAEESATQGKPAAVPASTPSESTVAAQPATASVAPSEPDLSQPAETAPAPTEAISTAPAVTTAPVEAPAPAAATTTPAKESEVSENVEFVSGEISAVDAANKSVTVKLYGETDDKAGDKVITVKTDDTTDITDGDKDRNLASLSAGTEVDVEYDPASNKATYIFVY